MKRWIIDIKCINVGGIKPKIILKIFSSNTKEDNFTGIIVWTAKYQIIVGSWIRIVGNGIQIGFRADKLKEQRYPEIKILKDMLCAYRNVTIEATNFWKINSWRYNFVKFEYS